MLRRVTVLAIGASVLVALSGCRGPCYSRAPSSGYGSLTSTGCRPTDPCYDTLGVPVSNGTGITPGTLIPSTGVPLMPGGGMGAPPPNELPLPGDMIPNPRVPSAPPSPAPGALGFNGASKTIQPVNGGK